MLAAGRKREAVHEARLASSPDASSLVRYAEQVDERPADAVVRRRLLEAELLLGSDGPVTFRKIFDLIDGVRKALGILDGVEDLRTSVAVVFAHEIRAEVLDRLGAHGLASRAHAAAALAAEAIGWIARATANVRAAKDMAEKDGDPSLLRRACEHDVRLADAWGDAPTRRSAQFDLACAWATGGDFVRAIASWEEIHADGTVAVDPTLRCMAATRLASAYIDLVELPPAERWLEASSKALERLRLEAGAPATDTDLQDAELELARGAYEYVVGRHAESVRRSGAALRLAESLGAEDLALRASANRGIALARMARLQEAEAVARKVVERFRASPDRASHAKALANLGDCFERSGRLEEATRVLEEAVGVLRPYPISALRAELRNHLGQVYAAMGRLLDSIEAHEEALLDARRVSSGWEAATAWMGLARAWSEQGEHWQALACGRRAAGIARENSRALSPWTAPYSRARWADLARAVLRSACAVADPEAVLDALELVRSDWRGPGSRGSPQAPDGGSLQASYDRSREQETRAWRSLREARESASVDPTELRTLERRAILCTDEVDSAASQLRRIRSTGGGSLDASGSSSPRDLLRQGEAFVSLGSVPNSRVLVVADGAGVRLILSPRLDSEQRPPASEVDACRSWAVGGWQPAAGVRTLLLSPDPACSDLPFAAMFPALHVHLVEGVSWLAHRPVPMPAGPLRTAAVLADEVRAGRLPGAAGEAQWIQGEIYSGPAATESRFRELCARQVDPFDVLHVSCHTRLDPLDPTRTALLLVPDDVEDGHVSIRELGALRVQDRLGLVVLGGCDTAKGVSLGGTGVLALSRAFLAAGAPRVLGSVWPVSDAATGEFLREFYAAFDRARQTGFPSPAAEALRQAQAAFATNPRYASWKDPKYWAAWVLWGLPE